MKTAIKIEVSRTDYSPKQVIKNRNVMTVAEVIEQLKRYDEDALVIVSHDNGYTYGALNLWYDAEEIEIPETDEEEEEMSKYQEY